MALSKWDDFFIHQSRHTVDRWESDDPGAFERHYVLAHSTDGSLYVMIGFALYPNRGIADAGVAIRHQGVQRNIFLSQPLAAGRDAGEFTIGPFRMRCIEPMQRWRIELGANAHGLECALEFDACSVPWAHNAERVEKFRSGGFDQALRFHGSVTVDGQTFSADGFQGGRNHTWGDHRPLGREVTSGTFGLDLVLWGFAHFDDVRFVLPVSLLKRAPRQADGGDAKNWAESSVVASQWQDGVFCFDNGRTVPVTQVRHRIELEPGVKWSYRKVELLLTCTDGRERHLVATPVSRECYLRGIGYSGRHGVDFGGYHVEGETWDVSRPHGIGHPLYGANDRVCRFELDGKPGTGFLENILSEDPDWRYEPTW